MQTDRPVRVDPDVARDRLHVGLADAGDVDVSGHGLDADVAADPLDLKVRRGGLEVDAASLGDLDAELAAPERAPGTDLHVDPISRLGELDVVAGRHVAERGGDLRAVGRHHLHLAGLGADAKRDGPLGGQGGDAVLAPGARRGSAVVAFLVLVVLIVERGPVEAEAAPIELVAEVVLLLSRALRLLAGALASLLGLLAHLLRLLLLLLAHLLEMLLLLLAHLLHMLPLPLALLAGAFPLALVLLAGPVALLLRFIVVVLVALVARIGLGDKPALVAHRPLEIPVRARQVLAHPLQLLAEAGQIDARNEPFVHVRQVEPGNHDPRHVDARHAQPFGRPGRLRRRCRGRALGEQCTKHGGCCDHRVASSDSSTARPSERTTAL